MSDQNPGGGDQTPPDPQHNPPPNWGNAYPPPPQYPQGHYQQGPYPPPAYGPLTPVPPKHAQATTAMVLGIISIAGGMACVLPVLLAPVAWILGAKAVKEIDANPAALSGRGEANAGKIMGIIGTVLGALAIIGLTIIIIIGVNGGFDDDYDSGYYDEYSISGTL